MEKPVIFYVDDEPHNLTVFEATIPDDQWDVRTFDRPLKALEALETVNPAVIFTDQRMPEITGVKFLELARKINDNAIRIVVTGYSDENLIIESVRKAQVFDYISKPWDPDQLIGSLARAYDYYKLSMERQGLIAQLQEQQKELESQNKELAEKTEKLKQTSAREENLRKELECWVSPLLIKAIKNPDIQFPIKKDLVGITYDIINSSAIHDINIHGRSLQSIIIQTFTESLLRHDGLRESHAGDSAYGHFGLFKEDGNPFDAALAVAREFRVALRSIAEVNKINVECGIALHLSKDTTVNVHTVQLNTPTGIVTQKSFDTTSSDIDLLHRIEKFAHQLPGTNIVMSEEFVQGLTTKPDNVTTLGDFKLKGQSSPVTLLIMASDQVTQDHLKKLTEESKEFVAAA